MTATIIDGRASRNVCAFESRADAPSLHARSAPGPRGRAGRRGSRQPGVCRQQDATSAGSRHQAFRSSPACHARRPRSSIALVRELNAREDVHGILVQLPLPRSVDSAAVLAAIDPAKDVDGFHAFNAGRLALGEDATVPCTPLGCLILIREVLQDTGGQARRGHRPIEHRRQADGATAATKRLHGDDRALADARSAAAVPRGRDPGRGDRPAARRSPAIGSARARS